MAHTDPYWASVHSSLIGEKLVGRVQEAGTGELTKGMYDRYARAYQYYFGIDPGGVHATSQVLRGGEQGELALVRVNHARSLVNTLLNLIVAPKIVWTPKATNVDYDSVRECELAAAVLEYYWQEKQVSKFAVRALEEALVFTEGYILAEWDEAGGEDYAPDLTEVDPEAPLDQALQTAPMLKSGDVAYHNVSAWDVIRDPKKTSYDALDWVIVRVWRNRYSLAAKYPQFAEQILAVKEDVSQNRFRAHKDTGDSACDDAPCYYFFHKKTPAVPNGREVVFLPNKVVLSDGPLSYDEVPLYRVSAGEMFGTPYGYTPFFDTLGIQELMDSLHTIIASNQTTFGGQVIAMEQGSEVPIDEIAGGMRAIYYPQGGKMPEAINFTHTPREIFDHLRTIKSDQEQVMGLNSVVRGEAESGEMSGAALALLQSQALQQSSAVQQNYLRFVEAVGNGTLSVIKDRLSVPQKVAITGKASQFLVREEPYTGQTFKRIKRVLVEIGNPLSQTAAGRITMADSLLERQLIHSTEEYVEVLTTGRIDPMTQSLRHELLNIRSENEQLARGEDPVVVDLDDHRLHAREHRAVLSNPEVRRKPNVVAAVLQHIQKHQDALYLTDPLLLDLVGQQPPMPQAPPEGGPPPGGPAPGPSQGPGAMASAMAPPQPELPSLPTNPASGAPWDPVTGGGVAPGPV